MVAAGEAKVDMGLEYKVGAVVAQGGRSLIHVDTSYQEGMAE
jgi:hypothetical protein